MKRLRTCETCARHVFESESLCPFCQHELAPPPSNSASVAMPANFSRAQRLAFVAALAGAGAAPLTGCGDDTSAAPDSGSVAVPIYGAPLPDGGIIPKPGAGTGGGGVHAAGTGAAATGGAGAQAQAQAGAAASGSASGAGGHAGQLAGAGTLADEDAGTPDGGTTVHPLYGAPVPVYGAPPKP